MRWTFGAMILLIVQLACRAAFKMASPLIRHSGCVGHSDCNVEARLPTPSSRQRAKLAPPTASRAQLAAVK